jgi:hypothetical protein
LAVRALPIDLHECPSQFLRLPWRGGFTGAQANGHVLDAHRLAGPQRQVADDAVALVQEAEHRDPLGHRRDSGLLRRCARHIHGDWLIVGRFIPGPVAGRRRQGQRDREKWQGPLHAYSGFHAS